MKLKCNSCNDEIYSEWPGQYVSCDCGRIFIDETQYYVRVGGGPDAYEILVEGPAFREYDKDRWVLNGDHRTKGGKTS